MQTLTSCMIWFCVIRILASCNVTLFPVRIVVFIYSISKKRPVFCFDPSRKSPARSLPPQENLYSIDHLLLYLYRCSRPSRNDGGGSHLFRLRHDQEAEEREKSDGLRAPLLRRRSFDAGAAGATHQRSLRRRQPLSELPVRRSSSGRRPRSLARRASPARRPRAAGGSPGERAAPRWPATGRASCV